MGKNDLILPSGEALSAAALLGEEWEAAEVRLWALLAEQTARYTMGDSASVPVETAQELLTSLRFTLDLYLKKTGGSPRLLLTEGLGGLLKQGQQLLQAETEEGRRLWRDVCLTAPRVGHIAYRDTLREIGISFQRYDIYFFAHRIPCSIDYQLCHPVPEELLGICYLNDYLRRLRLENEFLRRFDTRLVIRLLESALPDYRVLLINLCEPVIANAVGRILAGKQSSILEITEEDRAAIAALLGPLPESAARTRLREAGHRLCRALRMEGEDARDYLTRAAEDMYPRIAAALPAGNLEGIFVSFA